MSRPNNLAISELVSGRRRAFELASDRRVGAHSRRELRKHQRRWARVHWRPIVLVIFTSVVLAAIVFIFIPTRIAPYLVSAILTSTGWWLYVLMLETGGTASLRSGIRAEQWTADVLRKFQRHGWKMVNHVMLEYGDVDHALVGPGGFFAVETKFRSNWGDAKPYLEDMARSAAEAARQLRLRIDPKAQTVKALAVLWGPDVNDHFAGSFEVNGVTFCPGRHLADFIDATPSTVEAVDVHTAFAKLDDYVTNRDIGEIATSGELPRTVSHGIDDLFAISGTVIALFLAILAPTGQHPRGVWSIAVAGASLVAAVAVRRWRPRSLRLRFVTTAAITTAGGLGLLMAIATVASALR